LLYLFLIEIPSPEPSLVSLRTYLTSLGADHIFTYDELSNKALNLRSKIPELTGGKGVKLGLNCVGGKETSLMAGLLGYDTHSLSLMLFLDFFTPL
jgi:mitochondrial enoyl-[acyl-carrier protein] reductase / trans-2-enoyl-CoA reductase